MRGGPCVGYRLVRQIDLSTSKMLVMTLEVKNNPLKMIRSLPSRVLAISGGLFHPEMLCVDARGDHSLRCARSNQSEK